MTGDFRHRLFFFLLFAAIFASCYAKDDYCDQYDDCLEQVETKRSFCVQLMQERKANRTQNQEKSALSDVDECKVEHRKDMEALKGLILRKTEEYRNCLRSRKSSASAIMDATKQEKCDALMSAWSTDNGEKEEFLKLFKRQVSTGGMRRNRKQGRKNRRLQKKRERLERRRNNPVRKCFVEAKKLKKTCMKLSHCCTVADDCQLNYQTSPLHDQIEIAKHTARQSRRRCKEARIAAKKANKHEMLKREFDN